MMTNGCEAGCKVFTGGEIKHHQDCQYYEESMSKMYDDLKSEVKNLRLAIVSNFVLLAKPNYKAKDGTIKRGIEIDGKYYAPQNDC